MHKERPPDTITRLGELALASRLRRLADSFTEEAEDLYRDLGMDFQPRWFPLFQTLVQTSPLPITALAQALGLTHPGTRQIAEQLIEAGLVRELRRGRDRRERLLALTPKGRRLQETLSPIWAGIRSAARGFLEEAGIDLLGALDRLEALHRRRSIMDRTRDRLQMPARRRLEIVSYRPALRKHLRSLHDSARAARMADGVLRSALLEDPNARILRPGGSILFALKDGAVKGTCALRRHKTSQFELCLLTVSPDLDARPVEAAFLEAAADQLRRVGQSELYFCPRRTQRLAVQLGRRLGFQPTPAPAFLHPELRRSHLALKRNFAPAPVST